MATFLARNRAPTKVHPSAFDAHVEVRRTRSNPWSRDEKKKSNK